MNQKANVRNYGDVWFDKRAIPNISSLKNVQKRYRVTYDSTFNRAFIVHKPEGHDMHFIMHRDGLHYHDPSEKEIYFVQTVNENESGYSARQISDAKRARKLYSKVGFPSNNDFKSLINNNMILNCPVTVNDVDRANTIYSPIIATLIGKTTRTKYKPVVTDYVGVPPAIINSNKDITLSYDILFVNRIPFYATIRRHIKFTTVEAIPSRKLPQLIKSTQYVLDLYSERVFKVTTTLVDREFIPMRRELTTIGVHPNFATANEHVPENERKICVLKERARSCQHYLPFTYLPRLILIEMMHNADLWVMTPPLRAVSQLSVLEASSQASSFNMQSIVNSISDLMPKFTKRISLPAHNNLEPLALFALAPLGIYKEATISII